MTEAAAAIPTTTPEANGSGVTLVPSLEERANEAFGPSESVGEAGFPAGVASPAASVEPDAVAKAREERRAALAKLKSEERGKVDAMAAIRENDRLKRELTEERERSKAYATHVDPSKLTKEQFFELAAKNPDLSPQELGEWLRERMANPEQAAASAARRAVDPDIASLKKVVEDQQALINNFMQSQQQTQNAAQERHAAEQFYSFTRENETTAPLSAAALQSWGADEFYKLAHRAVQVLPPGAGFQAVLDEVEHDLESKREQIAAVFLPKAPTQQRQAPTQPNTAAAKAPTHVTNTLAQQRSSVVDEETDWGKLPYDERVNRLFR